MNRNDDDTTTTACDGCGETRDCTETVVTIHGEVDDRLFFCTDCERAEMAAQQGRGT